MKTIILKTPINGKFIKDNFPEITIGIVTIEGIQDENINSFVEYINRKLKADYNSKYPMDHYSGEVAKVIEKKEE